MKGIGKSINQGKKALKGDLKVEDIDGQAAEADKLSAGKDNEDGPSYYDEGSEYDEEYESEEDDVSGS